jgi:hypothetical protein
LPLDLRLLHQGRPPCWRRRLLVLVLVLVLVVWAWVAVVLGLVRVSRRL